MKKYHTISSIITLLISMSFTLVGQTITTVVTQDIEIRTDNPGTSLPVDVGSSDLELSGFDQDAFYSQVSYLRFANISVPAGATITNVQLKFFLKSSSNAANTLHVAMENSLSAASYPPSNTNDLPTGYAIQNTRQYSANLTWTTPSGSAGNPVLTPNLVSVLPAGMTGSTSSIAFRIRKADYNVQPASLFNVHSQNASNGALHPQLIIEYVTSNQITVVATEDIEIRTDNPGTSLPVDVGSSDLELSGFDEDLLYSQVSYLRFANISVPAGATITNVQLKFFLKSSPNAANTLHVAMENSLSAASYPASNTNDLATGFAIQNTRQYSANLTWTTPSGSAGNPVLTPNLVTALPAGMAGSTSSIAFRVRKADYNVQPASLFNVHSQNASNSALHPQLIIEYTLSTAASPIFVWSGGLTHNSINVRAKLSAAATNCKLAVSTDGTTWSSVGASISDVTTATNLMGNFSVGSLQPTTSYSYRISIDGTIATNLTGKFKTATAPNATDKSFNFLAGACNSYSYSNVGGLGVNFDFYTNMKNENPLFFLSSGDLHYGNPNQHATTSPSITNNRKAYEYLFFGNMPPAIYNSSINNAAVINDFFNNTENDYSFNPAGYTAQQYINNILSEAPKLRSFFQEIPIAYVWDDHDYSGDNSSGMPEWTARGNLAKQAYREYVPHYDFPTSNTAIDKPIYQAYTIGSVRFILTDLRSEQTDNEMMSVEQICWFKKECLLAKKNNQLISWVTSVGPTSNKTSGGNDVSGPQDLWGHGSKRTQRNLIFQWLKDAQIKNLFIISGDAHSLGIDDGYNTNCDNSTPSNNCVRAANSTSPRYPLFQTAPLFTDFLSQKDITTNLLNIQNFNVTTTEPNRGHYTKFEVIDTGSGSIRVKTTMKRIESGSVTQYALATNSYTGTDNNSDSYIESGNTYVFKRDLTDANPFNMTLDQSINSGGSIALLATCSGGTLTWFDGATLVTSPVSPTVTTTYTAKCDVGCSNIVELGTVTITVLTGPCGGVNQNLAITNTTLPLFYALHYITTVGTIMYPSGNREYVAGKSITITPPAGSGFWETSTGTIFQARINPNYVLCTIEITNLNLSKFGSNTTVGLSWTNPMLNSVTNYRIEYADAGNTNWAVLTTVASNVFTYSATTTGSSPFVLNSTYKFRVVALTSQGNFPSVESTVTCLASG